MGMITVSLRIMLGVLEVRMDSIDAFNMSSPTPGRVSKATCPSKKINNFIMRVSLKAMSKINSSTVDRYSFHAGRRLRPNL